MLTEKKWENLWEHQKKAVEKTRNYIESFSPDFRFKRRDMTSSALVRMPTGSGKSGVIAILCQNYNEKSNILVVTPSATLRDQLRNDIDWRFWKKVNISKPPHSKKVVTFTPSTLAACINSKRSLPIVLVSTIQTLERLFQNYKKIYRELMEFVSLVMVDEGHREPATIWAQAVRGLRRPTILFSATPYRNDHKVFNIDKSHIFVFPHMLAEQQKFVRKIEFIENAFGNAAEFVQGLLDFYKGSDFKKNLPKGVKRPLVIVRCRDEDSIRTIASLLQDKKQSVVAIHDTFNSQGYFRKQVPLEIEKKGETSEPLFWIHQWKILEGVDRPDFCILAIYEPLRNARSLVQQIGRIMRNTKRKPEQKAYVFTHPSFYQKEFWLLYRKYEAQFEKDPDLYESRCLYDTIVNIQPDVWHYDDKNFREKFDIDSSDIHLQINYKLATNIFQVNSNFSHNDLSQSIRKELKNNDYDVRHPVEKPDEETRFLSYLLYGNPEIFLAHYLFQYKVGYTIWHRIRDFLFFFDSEGVVPQYLYDNAKRIDPNLLKKLYDAQYTRIAQLSLLNTDLGDHSIRRRIITSRSLKDTAPGLSDHLNICSTSTGYTQSQYNSSFARYIGFTRARVSEPNTQRHDYHAYLKWLSQLDNDLSNSDNNEPKIFDRYASFIGVPKNTTPLNILFDIDEFFQEFVTNPGTTKKEENFYVDDICLDISHGTFTLVANSKPYDVKIVFNRKRERYELTCDNISKDYIWRYPNRGIIKSNLINYINRKQCFRIIPETYPSVYAHGRFYEPKLKVAGVGEGNRLDLINILHGDKKLGEIASEKGNKCKINGRGWERGCLFDLIDKKGKNSILDKYLKGCDFLVCDDMGTESADFIAVWRKSPIQRIAYIHAKAFTTERKRSASAFHDICGQAVKNLDYLSPYSIMEQNRVANWAKSWQDNKVEGKVKKRIRKGKGTPSEIWAEMQKVIRDTSASREVWIVLGQGFSKSTFNLERLKRKPRPEIIQIVYLLQSLWSAVSSIGATLKVFCSE